ASRLRATRVPASNALRGAASIYDVASLQSIYVKWAATPTEGNQPHVAGRQHADDPGPRELPSSARVTLSLRCLLTAPRARTSWRWNASGRRTARLGSKSVR